MKIMFLLFVLCSFANANTQWTANKDHSEILFKISYLEVSEVTGRFNDYVAMVEFDEKNQPTQVSVIIKSDSIDTAQKLRDSHLKREEFFATQTHPEITFKSSKITAKSKNTFTVDGTITIKSISKPLTVEVEISKEVKDTWGHNNKFAKFSSKINRKDFNIKWNKTLDEQKFLVGDTVQLWGVFQLQPLNDKTPPSKHMIPDTEYIRGREDKIRNQKKEEESSFSKKIRNVINGQ